MQNRIFQVAVICLSIVLFSSCGSSRKAVSSSAGSSSLPGRPSSIHISDNLDDASRSLLAEAQTWLGTKYKYGGHSKSGTDCSGMVMEVFLSSAGIKLPRSSREQHNYCRKVSRDDLVPGDLVFFANNLRTGRIGHVGLYVGDGQMIHASTSRGVIVSRLNEDYWHKHYAASGRVEAFEKMAKKDSKKQKKKEDKKNKKEKKDKKNKKKKKQDRGKRTENRHNAPTVSEPVTLESDGGKQTAPIESPHWFD